MGISGGFHQVLMDTPEKDTVGMDNVGKCWQNEPIRLHIYVYSAHSLSHYHHMTSHVLLKTNGKNFGL